MAEKKRVTKADATGAGAGPASGTGGAGDTGSGKIVLNPPTPKSAGYLARQREALEFWKRMNEKSIDPTLVDDLVDFFMPYVTYPEGEDEVRHALEFYATEEDITGLLEAISGAFGGGGGKGPFRE